MGIDKLQKNIKLKCSIPAKPLPKHAQMWRVFILQMILVPL